MAHVMDHPVDTVESKVPTQSVLPASEPENVVDRFAQRPQDEPVPPEAEEVQVPRTYFGMPAWLAFIAGLLILAAIVTIGVSFAWYGQGSAKKAAVSTGSVVTQSNPVSKVIASSGPLSASDIKEMKGRDDYATNLSKFLHAKMPAYKNVKIYADNWAGTKAPGKSPLIDIKARTGDNLMLVFWSPDAGTARGLSDFAKSPAATEAINAGFAEFQFVDPDSYCYAEVVPVAGVRGVACGIR